MTQFTLPAPHTNGATAVPSYLFSVTVRFSIVSTAGLMFPFKSSTDSIWYLPASAPLKLNPVTLTSLPVPTLALSYVASAPLVTSRTS